MRCSGRYGVDEEELKNFGVPLNDIQNLNFHSNSVQIEFAHVAGIIKKYVK